MIKEVKALVVSKDEAEEVMLGDPEKQVCSRPFFVRFEMSKNEIFVDFFT